MKVKLYEIASVIRSKNAGPYELTLDVLLKDDATYQKFAKSQVINKELISKRVGDEVCVKAILDLHGAHYGVVSNIQVINKELISKLYNTPLENIISIVYFENARAIKATIVRPYPSGALCERDVYGAQQHYPLMNAEVEIPD